MNRTRSLGSQRAAGPLVSASRQRGGGLAWRLAIGLGVLGLSAAAHADMAPGPPPPECVGKPDGTLCVMSNGTAGKCKTGQWGRTPGRTWVSCESDKAECDNLQLGAACHGYLGKPAHCKEFTSPEKKTWRTCQVDAADAPAADSPAPAPAPVVAATPTAETPAAAPAKKGLLSCTAAPGVPAAGGTGALVLGAVALWLGARRRIKAAA